jgi:Ca2+ transporting ATPase
MNKDQTKEEETTAATPLMNSQVKSSYPTCPSIEFFLYLFDITNIGGKTSSKTYMAEGGTEIFKKLKTDPENGLDMNNKADLEWRVKTWKDNTPIHQEIFGFFHFVVDSLGDPMLQILLLAAAVSMIIGIIQEGFATGWIEGATIFLAVFIVVSISSYINYEKDQQFHALNDENIKKNVAVKRNGEEKFVDVSSLLVGDVLQLNIGDITAVDGILTKGFVTIDEGSMTGESEKVKKTPGINDDSKGKCYSPFILSGTKVMEGAGEMIVCSVGENTRMNKIMELAGAEDECTPLQEKLGDLAEQIGIYGTIGAGIIGVVLILKDILIKVIKGESIFVKSTIDAILNAFIIAVVVIVVAIPEGLPMAVTISLAYSVRAMSKENNLVKHLNAAETMGNVK